jgi:hypothetical protein
MIANSRWGLLQQSQDTVAKTSVVSRRFARSRPILQTAYAIVREPTPPLADSRNRRTDPPRYLLNFLSFQTGKHNARTLHHAHFTGPTAADRNQLGAVLGTAF